MELLVMVCIKACKSTCGKKCYMYLYNFVPTQSHKDIQIHAIVHCYDNSKQRKTEKVGNPTGD